MDKAKLIGLLKDHNKEDAEKYAAYIHRLAVEKDTKTGKPKNYWLINRTEEELAGLFSRVAKDGLVFDGTHITLQKTGISYDYVAYKNKMLVAYPESKIDVALVYKGDEFGFTKADGQVLYTHTLKNPFGQKDDDIIGGYCVIKNKRGEFLTVLTKEDFEKHRKLAKTDMIWNNWNMEMCLKTVIKKACKQHFDDIYQSIDEIDNENYSLDNPLSIELKWKQEIDAINDLGALRLYWQENKGRGKDFDKYVTMRKEQIVKLTQKNA